MKFDIILHGNKKIISDQVCFLGLNSINIFTICDMSVNYSWTLVSLNQFIVIEHVCVCSFLPFNNFDIMQSYSVKRQLLLNNLFSFK